MADSPSDPSGSSEPGWPFGEPPEIPAAPPTAPYEPPAAPAYQQPPPGAPTYEPPGAPTYQPPAAPAHQPPPAAPAYQQPPPVPYQTQPPPPQPGLPPPNYGAPPSGHGYPQPPPPQPGYSGYPPQPKKSRKGLWITLGIIFGCLALGIGACSIWAFSALTAPIDASNEFLAAIDRGDYQGAVAMTDPTCNGGLTVTELDELFAGEDISYNLNSSNITNSSARVTGSLRVGFGSEIPGFALTLRNADDGWRVCRFG